MVIKESEPAPGTDTEQVLEFDGLPDRPDPSTWVTEQPGEPVPDSSGGRDFNTEALLRSAGS